MCPTHQHLCLQYNVTYRYSGHRLDTSQIEVGDLKLERKLLTWRWVECYIAHPGDIFLQLTDLDMVQLREEAVGISWGEPKPSRNSPRDLQNSNIRNCSHGVIQRRLWDGERVVVEFTHKRCIEVPDKDGPTREKQRNCAQLQVPGGRILRSHMSGVYCLSLSIQFLQTSTQFSKWDPQILAIKSPKQCMLFLPSLPAQTTILQYVHKTVSASLQQSSAKVYHTLQWSCAKMYHAL